MKTFKGTIGTKEFFIELNETKYTALAAELGFTLTTAADVQTGDFVADHQTLKKNGLVFELSIGLAGGKRSRCLIGADNLANRGSLVGKSWGTKTITSASIRTYSKLR